MENVKSYKCPCCSAPLVFDASIQNLKCGSCGNEFSAETLAQIDEAEASVGADMFDWENYEPREFDAAEASGLSTYSCPSCGAEITGDSAMAATMCPYCGNAAIVEGNFSGSLMPDYIIPFKVNKAAAMAAFEETCKKLPFLPNTFKDKRKIEEMAGIYVPYWMFDCDCNAVINYSAQRVTHWSDSNYNYTKTDYFKLLRAGSIGFANIPVDGSIKADNAYTEAIEPFDYSEAVNFKTAYISGYLADKYDVSASDCEARANERVKRSTEDAFASTTRGYMAVQPQSSHVGFSNGKVRYALLPVWMLNVRYGENVHKIAINGQTGKVVGDYPIDKTKRNLHFLKVFGIAFAVAAALIYLYFRFM